MGLGAAFYLMRLSGYLIKSAVVRHSREGSKGINH